MQTVESHEVHYVEFLSPGTLVSETSMRKIAAWNIKTAVKMARGVQERHGACPYGFRFKTFLEAPPVSDGRGGILDVTPKLLQTSSLHFINGKVILYDDVPETDDNHILRGNMRCNRAWVVVETRNSWKHTAPFEAEDCCVDDTGKIIREGKDADLMAYRKKMDRKPGRVGSS